LKALSWNAFFRSIAGGLLGIFVPVYIFLLAKERWGSVRGAILFIGIYVVIQRLVIIFSAIKMGELLGRLGFRRSILIASFLEVIGYLFLIRAGSFFAWLWLLPFVTALSIKLYWLPRHSLLAEDEKDRVMGRSLGWLNLIERGAGILGPFAGGVIATIFGFTWLFGIGLVLMIFSAIPMFFMPHHDHDDGISWKEFFVWIKEKKHRWFVLSFVGRGLDDTVGVWVWPLFVFAVVGSLEYLGGVTSAVLLLSMLAIFLASTWFDKKKNRKLIGLAIILTAVTRFVRGLAGSLMGIFALDSVNRVASPFFWLGVDRITYITAKHEEPFSFFVYREMIYSLGRMISALVLILCAGLANFWIVMWAVAALGIMLNMGMVRERR